MWISHSFILNKKIHFHNGLKQILIIIKEFNYRIN